MKFNKRNTFKIISLSTLVFFGFILLSALSKTDEINAQTTIESIRQRFFQDKQAINRTHEEKMTLFNDVVSDVKERNLKFRVELNEIMDHSIEEVTGSLPPLPQDVRRQEEARRKQEDELRREEEQRKRQIEEEERLKKEELDRAIQEEQDRRRREELQRQEEARRKAEEERMRKEASAAILLRQNVPPSMVPLVSSRAFNWRDIGKTTPVKHQKTCGSCWAFAANTVYETNYKIKNNVELDLSDQYIVDCAVDGRGRKVGSCNGGWYLGVYDFYLKNGGVIESVLPYQNKESGCRPVRASQVQALPSRYTVINRGYVSPDGGIPSVAQMKEAISKYGAITASVKVTPAFQAYAGGIFDEHARVSGPRDINHAIVIIGWDDDKKSYLIENSWGTRWGENGFMWIEYGCNNIGFGAAWAVVALEK